MQVGDQTSAALSARYNQILSRYDLTRDLVIVAGDLNDTPNSAPLKPVLGLADLHDVLKGLPQADRWTYHFKKNEQIDYILASTPLHRTLAGSGVFRRGMFDVAKHTTSNEKRFPSITSDANSASDHGCVWAEFNV